MPSPSGDEVVSLLPPRKTRRRRRDQVIAPFTVNGTLPVRRKPTLSATMFRLPFKVPFSASHSVYFLELIIGILWYSFRVRHRDYHPSTREWDIRAVWSYLRILSKDIQYRSQILLYRFRILLHRFRILLYDMGTVMFLAMVVDAMTNIWDMWYIGRSHLLTQGISHAMLFYRILAMLLLSELVQEALFSPHQAYWIIPLCYPLVVLYSIATECWYSYLKRFVSKVASFWEPCPNTDIRSGIDFAAVHTLGFAHVWRDSAAIILFDASKSLVLTAITFVPIKCLLPYFLFRCLMLALLVVFLYINLTLLYFTLACLYVFLIKGVWLTSPLVITSAFAEYMSELMSNQSLHSNGSSAFADAQGQTFVGKT